MDDKRSWLILLNTPKLGARTLVPLLETYGSPGNILAAADRELLRSGLTKETIQSLRQQPAQPLAQQLHWLQQPGHHLVAYNEEFYPEQLRHIADPPAVLFIEGCVESLQQRQLAIVGSRNPSATGRKTAHRFAAQLAGAGFIISSGLALGIDACAHQGALTAGQTVAVLGNGTDICYPARHRKLAGEICAQGALVSEFPPGTPPLAGHFPRRNRIISGLSLGVIVMEAATRSGSLITARCALEQGREVFAVPGSIHSPLSAGCHQLIKQGAKLVESVLDVLEEFRAEQMPEKLFEYAESRNGELTNPDLPSAECQLILQYLSHDPQTLDELIESSGLTADTVSSMLLVLEVQGVVSSSGGQYTKIN